MSDIQLAADGASPSHLSTGQVRIAAVRIAPASVSSSRVSRTGKERTTPSRTKAAACSTTAARSASPSSSQSPRRWSPKTALLGPQRPSPPRSQSISCGQMDAANARSAGERLGGGVARELGAEATGSRSAEGETQRRRLLMEDSSAPTRLLAPPEVGRPPRGLR